MGMYTRECSICGKSLEDINGVCLIKYWWINGKPVCKECAKKLAGRCSICGEFKGWCKHKEIKNDRRRIQESKTRL